MKFQRVLPNIAFCSGFTSLFLYIHHRTLCCFCGWQLISHNYHFRKLGWIKNWISLRHAFCLW